MFRVQQFINRARYYRSPPLQWRSANVQHAHLEFGSRVFCSYNHSGRAPREYGSGRDTFSGSKIAFQAWESILHFDHDLMKIVVRFFRGVRSAAEGRQGPLSENFAFLPFFQILADCNLKFQSIVWQFWHLKKLSKNKDEILYSNHCFEKSYLNFVCSTSYLPPYKIYLETKHLIENFASDWYLTTNMLEFPKPGREFKMMVFLKRFFILLFVYHSENFQKCSVCVRFYFVSCLSSEEESLHTLSKRLQ